MVVDNPLIRPYFLRGSLGGVPLDSHDMSNFGGVVVLTF